MNKAPLRIGLLGTGVAAHRLYQPAFELLEPRLKLVACANRTRAKAVKYARFAGFERVEESPEALFHAPDIDAVIISLPIDVQPAFVLAALRAGKAVLSEKPVAGTVARAKRLISQSKSLTAPWMIGENYAFMSHVRRLGALVRANKFGRIRLVEARQINWMDRKNPYFATPWRAQPKHVGGFVVDGGVHVAHVLHRCFGAVEVCGAVQGSFEASLPPLDTALAVLRFEDGALGTWTSCFSARDSHSPIVRILGDRGNAALFHDRLEVVSSGGKVTTHAAGGNSFAAQFAHFADVVQRGVALDVTPEAALQDLQLVSQICGARG